jgi:hypothetical protein
MLGLETKFIWLLLHVTESNNNSSWIYSVLLTFLAHRFFAPWWWRQYISVKCQLTRVTWHHFSGNSIFMLSLQFAEAQTQASQSTVSSESTVNGFQGWIFPFLWVPHLSHTNSVARNLVPTFMDRGVSRGQRGKSPMVVNLICPMPQPKQYSANQVSTTLISSMLLKKMLSSQTELKSFSPITSQHRLMENTVRYTCVVNSVTCCLAMARDFTAFLVITA